MVVAKPVAEAFEGRLAAACRGLGLRGARLVVAVSGGGDSMALLHGLARLQGRMGLVVSAATVDHGLREVSGDLAVVASACAALGVHAEVLPVEVPPGPGVEARAREARYRVLSEARARAGASAIVTAHTASDQAETVLMRLSRGAALDGAAGVLSRRGDGVVRPLLWATRAEAKAYLAALGAPFASDPMNLDRQFLRVRLRLDVLPALALAAGPHAEVALARFAELAAEDEALLAGLAEAAWTRACVAPGVLDRVAVAAMQAPLARRVLVRWCREVGVAVDAASIALALDAVRAGGTATLPGDSLLACRNGEVRWEPAPPRRRS